MNNSAIKGLVNNDPNLIKLELSISNDAELQTLAKALTYNTKLNVLTITTIEPRETEFYCGWQALANALKINKALRVLNLRHNKIGPSSAQAFAEALAKNNSLQELSITSSRMGNEEAQALANALKNNPTLEKLDLNDNMIGNNGAEAFANALPKNKTLRILDLSANWGIGRQGINALANALVHNHTLYLTLSDNYRIEYGIFDYSVKQITGKARKLSTYNGLTKKGLCEQVRILLAARYKSQTHNPFLNDIMPGDIFTLITEFIKDAISVEHKTRILNAIPEPKQLSNVSAQQHKQQRQNNWSCIIV